MAGPLPHAYLTVPGGADRSPLGRSATKSPGEPYEVTFDFRTADMDEASAVIIRGPFANGAELLLRIPLND
ncbi:hypothetical protein ACQCX1_05705 [Propionibacteriaceae bacterium Y2014]